MKLPTQQALIQGCQIETPHSEAIRTICGTAMCAGPAGLGPELYPGRTNITGSGWVDNGDDTYTHTGTVSGDLWFLLNDGTLVLGQWYQIQCTKSMNAGLAILVGSPGAGNYTETVTAPGDYTIYLQVENLNVDAVRFTSAADGEIVSGISIREYYGTIPANIITDAGIFVTNDGERITHG